MVWQVIFSAWNMNFESTTLSQLTAQCYFASVSFNNFFYITKAETKTFYIMNVSCRHAIKFLEDTLLMFSSNTNAVVNDLNQTSAGVIRCSDNDLGDIFAVFNSIVNQVIKNTSEMKFISLDPRKR